jgi:hypothetical protein
MTSKIFYFSHIPECQYHKSLARKQTEPRTRTAPALIAHVRSRLSRRARGEVKSAWGESYTEMANARREAQTGPANRRIVNTFFMNGKVRVDLTRPVSMT